MSTANLCCETPQPWRAQRWPKRVTLSRPHPSRQCLTLCQPCLTSTCGAWLHQARRQPGLASVLTLGLELSTHGLCPCPRGHSRAIFSQAEEHPPLIIGRSYSLRAFPIGAGIALYEVRHVAIETFFVPFFSPTRRVTGCRRLGACEAMPCAVTRGHQSVVVKPNLCRNILCRR
jgi:hypothetical protein